MNDDADTLSIVQQPDDKTRIIASANTWIEGEAVRQLQATAKMPGMRYCVGLPDMQPGKGSPSGAAFASGLIQPHLVGTDSGCGIALFRTDLKAHKINPKKMAALLDGLDHPWDGDTAAFSVIAVLRPLVTFKTSEGARVVARDSKERWQRERQAARAAKRSLR